MLRSIRPLLALVLLLPLAACLVELKTPLSDPSPATFDERLIGLWSAEGERERIEIRFTPNKALVGTMNVTYTEFNKKERKPPQALRFRAWRASIGGRDYLTLVPTDGKESQSGRQFAVFYELKGDSFAFALMRERPVADAIKAKKLEGAVDEKNYGRVTLTAPRDKIAAFLTENHAELFGDMIPLTRVKPR